jgi:hypothetical protein
MHDGAPSYEQHQTAVNEELLAPRQVAVGATCAGALLR